MGLQLGSSVREVASRLHLAVGHPDGGKPTPATAPVRVVLADEHPLMRRTLHDLLSAHATVDVIAVAGDMATAAAMVRQQHPDVLVVNLSMSNGAAVEHVRALRAANPATQIVVVTSDDSAAVVQRVLGAGALGYVLSALADTELPEAVLAAARHEEYVSPRLGARLRQLYSSLADDRITPREVEVLRLIALGHTSVEIANKLHLSPRTIETHRAHIHRKLGLTTRAQLVRYALRRGMLRE